MNTDSDLGLRQRSYSDDAKCPGQFGVRKTSRCHPRGHVQMLAVGPLVDRQHHIAVDVTGLNLTGELRRRPIWITAANRIAAMTR
jgi:hypothetical protein